MKEKARYFFAGLFIGLAELLPGISGATVALMFGVYEKLLSFCLLYTSDAADE